MLRETRAFQRMKEEAEWRRQMVEVARSRAGEHEGIDGVFGRSATGYSTDQVFKDVRFKLTFALREVGTGVLVAARLAIPHSPSPPFPSPGGACRFRVREAPPSPDQRRQSERGRQPDLGRGAVVGARTGSCRLRWPVLLVGRWGAGEAVVKDDGNVDPGMWVGTTRMVTQTAAMLRSAGAVVAQW